MSAGAYRQLHDALPDHIQEVRSTVVEPYATGPSSVSQDFPAEI
jgi:hypothetical protein